MIKNKYNLEDIRPKAMVGTSLGISNYSGSQYKQLANTHKVAGKAARNVADWFLDQTVQAAVRENSAIAQASGWTMDDKGHYYITPETANTEGAKRLRENLADIAMMVPGGPIDAAVGFGLKQLGRFVRPLWKSYKEIGKAQRALGSGKQVVGAVKQTKGNVIKANYLEEFPFLNKRVAQNTTGAGIVGTAIYKGATKTNTSKINKAINRFFDRGILSGGITKRGTLLSKKSLEDIAKETNKIAINDLSSVNFLNSKQMAENGAKDFIAYYDPISKEIAFLKPKTSPFKKTAAKKMAGTAHHEVYHADIDFLENDDVFPTLTRTDDTSDYFYANPDVLSKHGYKDPSTFPMNKHKGQWEGSPEELGAEIANLNRLGLIQNNKIHPIGRRALQGRFDLSPSELDESIQFLKNGGYLDYMKPNYKAATNKDIALYLLDGHYSDIIKYGRLVGLGAAAGAASGYALNIYRSKSSKSNKSANKNK